MARSSRVYMMTSHPDGRYLARRAPRADEYRNGGHANGQRGVLGLRRRHSRRQDHLFAGVLSRKPWFLSQVSQSFGHILKGRVRRDFELSRPPPSPRPCGPRSKRCSSTGTPALRRARAKRRLFSAGTPRVGVGVGEEGRRRVLGHLPLVGEALDQLLRRVVTQQVVQRPGMAVRGRQRDHGIDQNQRGRDGELTRSIGSSASGLPASKWVAGRRRQVTAGREADDRDLVRIEAPLRRTGADRPDRAAGVVRASPDGDSAGPAGT